ncbi:MAG: hypothetical protein KatS3mg036_0330 [Ignavibacterium sp.]|nr:MAG: hypothetical protein KatS3mg036_0330 [Ignavibacterium sp.]
MRQLLILAILFSISFFNFLEAQRREVRAVWIATAGRLDFPHNTGSSSSKGRNSIFCGCL